MNPAERELRALRAAAGQASDAQLLKLVGMLDQLPDRRATDALLEPVRPRLRALRPARPLSLARLLFLPLDAVLVAPRDWRGDARRVPRNAIAPLLATVRAAEPGLAAEVEAAVRGRTMQEAWLCGPLGERLWPAAAAALPAPPPTGWAEAGLPPGTYPGIRRVAETLWRHGPGIWALRQAGPDGPPEEPARRFLRGVAAEGPEAVALVLAALLPFAARPAQFAAVAAGIDRALAPVAEQALDAYLDGLSAPGEEEALAATVAAASRFAGLIEDLDRCGTRDRPRRAQQLQALRHAAAATCSARLAREAEAGLHAPLAALLGAAAVSDGEIEALEARARALHELAEASRRLQPGVRARANFERALALLAAALPRLPAEGPGFLRADALRLAEILAGPEFAQRLGGG